MNAQRWNIVRRLLFLLLIGVGVAFAARKVAPPPPPPAVEAAPTTPPPPKAPPLFQGGLPIAAQQVPPGLPSLSAQGCNACHGEIHDAWAESAHAGAWNAEAFRAALDRVGDTTACTGCHLPLANQHPRLAAGYIEGDVARPDMQPNPAWDATLMSEGVTCAACHVRDGAVVANRTGAAGPHPITVSDELGTSELCATCHQLTWPGADPPFYDTYGEWKASAYAQAGVGCKDCHMPPVAGRATATRFAAMADHSFPADTARALSILVRTDAPEAQRGSPLHVAVRLQNTGAGHSVPTGSPFKAYRVVVGILDADGTAAVSPYSEDLARTVQDAPPWNTLTDTRLPAGGERLIEHDFTIDQRKHAGRGTLLVAIYRLDAKDLANPRWSPDKAGPPLARQQIPLPIL